MYDVHFNLYNWYNTSAIVIAVSADMDKATKTSVFHQVSYNSLITQLIIIGRKTSNIIHCIKYKI